MKYQISKILLLAGIIAVFASGALITRAVPPTPGIGSGAIATDASNNVSIGTSATQANTKLLIAASSTDTTNYALRIIQPAGTPILFVRNDGSVSIATSSFGNALTVDGTIYSTNNFNGTVAAANVTPGVFNGSTGGNYAFNGALGVNTPTQVGLPAALAVYGTSDKPQILIQAYSIQTTPVMKFLSSSGAEIGRIQSDANQNLFMGKGAGAGAAGTATYNTAVGYGAAEHLITGTRNTAVGSNAMQDGVISGSYNVAVGESAAYALGSASYNTALGADAMRGGQGSKNTAVGYQSMWSTNMASENTAVGYQSLYSNFAVDSTENTALGYQALYSSDATANTAIGYRALFSNTSGYENTAVGDIALGSNITGNDNVAVGFNALYFKQSGSGNTVLGVYALRGDPSGDGGDNNVAVGYLAGLQSKGSSNVFLGYQTGFSNTDGDSNVFIGTNAGYHEFGSNKLYINSNPLALGVPPLIYGDFQAKKVGINTTTPSVAFAVEGDIYASGNITCGGTCGGEGLPALGTSKQVLRVNSAATGLEYAEPTKDISWFRQVGTSPIERWYGNLHIQTNTYTTGVPVVNTLYAFPFTSGRGGTLDRIQFNVTTGGAAGSVARVGIYTSTSDTNLYPNALVVDGGQFDTTSTGVKTATISAALTENKLYWLVFLSGTAAPTVRAGQPSSMPNVLGIDSAMGTGSGIGLNVARAYGALPGTFPAGATVQTSSPIPIITVRYSN